jgi:tetratricopeptide (TPR) repeat protein
VYQPTTPNIPSLADPADFAEGAQPRERTNCRGTQALDELAAGEQALYASGDLVAAHTAFGQAFELANTDADAETMATAAIGLGGIWVHERRSAVDAANVEARQQISLAALDTESSLALRLRIRLAAEADYRTGRSSDVLRLLDEARTRADPVVLAEALSLAHQCVLGPEHADMRIGLADELLRVATLTDRPSDMVMGLVWRAADLFLAGDRQAERAYTDLLSHEPANRHAAAAFATQAMRVMLTIRSGHLGEAEALAEICARAGAAAGDVDWMGTYTAHVLTVRRYQGRIAEMVDTLSNIVNSPALSAVDHSFVAAQAVACAAAGQLRRARGALARVIGPHQAELPMSSSWLAAMTATIEAAALLEDHAAAARAYRLLLPYANLPVMAGIAVACFGSAQHPLGVACLVTRDVDRAVEHFEAAVAHNSALGNWPAAALSRHRLAEALALRGALGDAKLAADLYAGSAAEAAELGMRLPDTGNRGRSGRSLARVWTRSGRHWRIDLGDRSAVVDDMVGIRHLATLVANPGVDISAIDLAEPGHAVACAATQQPVLDEEAVRQFRSRLRALAAQIKQAELLGDGERVIALRAEADWLRHEVEANTGLGGRSRHFADSSERARIAVGKAIRRALERIAAADADIGAELRACVETGAHCSYRPSDG